MSEGIGQTMRQRHDAAGRAGDPSDRVFQLVADPALPIDDFARLICRPDLEQEVLDAWIARHAPVPLPELLLDLVTPAARLLGEWWVRDECSFCDVTLGMHRLTLLLIELETRHRHASAAHGQRVLVSIAPQDQHGFGPALLATFLRRAGWDVTADLAGDADAIVAATARDHYVAVALSIGHERAILPAAALIARVRAASLNPAITILVGGPMIIADPNRVRLIGADATADDAPGAAAYLARFIDDTSQMV